MHRILFFIGGFFILSGLFYLYGEKLGIGKLPGDITIKGDNYQFHFPIVTCIIISLVISGIMWLFRMFRS